MAAAPLPPQGPVQQVQGPGKNKCGCVAVLFTNMIANKDSYNPRDHLTYADCAHVKAACSADKQTIARLIHKEDEFNLFRLACQMGRDKWVTAILQTDNSDHYDLADEMGVTPFMLTCMSGNYVCAYQLLNYVQCHVEAKTKYGVDCLRFAVASTDANKLCRLIIRNGINVKAQDAMKILWAIRGNSTVDKDDLINLFVAVDLFHEEVTAYGYTLYERCLPVVRKELCNNNDNLCTALARLPLPSGVKKFLFYGMSVLNHGEDDGNFW